MYIFFYKISMLNKKIQLEEMPFVLYKSIQWKVSQDFISKCTNLKKKMTTDQ
jgi:hypothetical protein